jgi:hypothetical protein
MYEYGLTEIERAYRSSRSSLDEDQARVNASYDDYKRQAGAAFEEDGYTDHLIDLHQSGENALRLIREAFAITLHHFWEKECNAWMKVRRYQSGTAYKALVAKGYAVDKTGLEKLRKTANCIKHGSDELYRQYPAMFRRSVASELKAGTEPDYHDDLELTDAHVEEFIATLHASGPPHRLEP